MSRLKDTYNNEIVDIPFYIFQISKNLFYIPNNDKVLYRGWMLSSNEYDEIEDFINKNNLLPSVRQFISLIPFTRFKFRSLFHTPNRPREHFVEQRIKISV